MKLYHNETTSYSYVYYGVWWVPNLQALLSLPREERQEYRSLMGGAALLVEQLLIYKKVHSL